MLLLCVTVCLELGNPGGHSFKEKDPSNKQQLVAYPTLHPVDTRRRERWSWLWSHDSCVIQALPCSARHLPSGTGSLALPVKQHLLVSEPTLPMILLYKVTEASSSISRTSIMERNPEFWFVRKQILLTSLSLQQLFILLIKELKLNQK